MGRFTSKNAVENGRRGGQRSYQNIEQEYADLVLKHPSLAQRVAHLIGQGFRLALAMRSVRISDGLEKDGE